MHSKTEPQRILNSFDENKPGAQHYTYGLHTYDQFIDLRIFVRLSTTIQ